MCLVETVKPASVLLCARIQLTRQRDCAVGTLAGQGSAVLVTKEQMMLNTGG